MRKKGTVRLKYQSRFGGPSLNLSDDLLIAATKNFKYDASW